MALRLISDSMSPKAEGGLVNNNGTIGTLLWDLTIAYTPKNHEPVAMLLRTGLNNVVLPHCSRLSTMVNNIVIRHSASTTLFNIVDNYKQCGQHLGSTTLFNPVELQAHDFLPCSSRPMHKY